jgi:hypothetical protein
VHSAACTLLRLLPALCCYTAGGVAWHTITAAVRTSIRTYTTAVCTGPRAMQQQQSTRAGSVSHAVSQQPHTAVLVVYSTTGYRLPATWVVCNVRNVDGGLDVR